MTAQPHVPSPPRWPGVVSHPRQQARGRALEEAADRGRLAPSVHNTQPWTFVLHPGRLELRADRSRQLPALDPSGRALVQSAGAALLNVRAALAARGWALAVERLPQPDDPDLLAVVTPVDGAPDSSLAPLDRAIPHRRTNRRPFDALAAPADLLQLLAAAAAVEETWLAAVRAPEELHLLASATQEAEGILDADAAYRAELAAWTTRSPADGDGISSDVLPHSCGDRPDDPPVRNFHPRRDGLLPSHRRSRSGPAFLLLATEGDDPRAWLRSGEALERVLLELTRRGWVASPMTQALEVPAMRARLRGLTGDAHPQMVLRIGRAAATPPTPRRPRRTVVLNSTRTAEPLRTRGLQMRQITAPPEQPVSDGWGGTTWA